MVKGYNPLGVLEKLALLSPDDARDIIQFFQNGDLNELPSSILYPILDWAKDVVFSLSEETRYVCQDDPYEAFRIIDKYNGAVDLVGSDFMDDATKERLEKFMAEALMEECRRWEPKPSVEPRTYTIP